MSRNIINISSKCILHKLFILAHDTAHVRCIFTCTQLTSSHCTVALDIFQRTNQPITSICSIDTRNATCHSIRTGDNRALVIAVFNNAVVFAYQATNIAAIAFDGIAIAGNAADFAAVIFCCYSANAVTSIFACEYGRGNIYVFNYRATAQLAEEAAVSLQADNRVSIAVKRSCKFYIASTDSIIGAIALCIHQAAGIYIIFQDIVIA